MPKLAIFRATKEGLEQGLREKDHSQTTTEAYLFRFQEYSTECLCHAYASGAAVLRVDSTGALSSSLTEDVVSLCYLQWTALRDYSSTNRSCNEQSLVLSGMLHVVRTMRVMHQSKLSLHWTTLMDCCRAANDFIRMADKLEVLWCKLCVQHPYLQAPSARKLLQDTGIDADTANTTLFDEWNNFICILSCDAVACAERAQVFMLRHLANQTTIGTDFFSSSWEKDLTDNQVMIRLIKVIDAYLADLKHFLASEHLWCKALLTTCKAVVCLYVRCLVERADVVTGRRRNHNRRAGTKSDRKPFSHADRALRRMRDDVSMLRDFFLVEANGNPALSRILSDELRILEVIHECLNADDASSIESFVVVIHKRTGVDILVTRCFLSDLWMLVAHRPGKQDIERVLASLETDLQLVSTRVQEQCTLDKKSARNDMSFVRLDDMLRVMYEDRIVQGMLPACWTCVPKMETEDSKVAIHGIRHLMRKLDEFRWNKASAWAR
ncbi:hypothetical protein MPSEU_000569200 [Mayamaea pseudoterrestris]|nr:hypothetical protein MPSEU_000569200 [Mayamaea pseudoterrestris]